MIYLYNICHILFIFIQNICELSDSMRSLISKTDFRRFSSMIGLLNYAQIEYSF